MVKVRCYENRDWKLYRKRNDLGNLSIHCFTSIHSSHDQYFILLCRFGQFELIRSIFPYYETCRYAGLLAAIPSARLDIVEYLYSDTAEQETKNTILEVACSSGHLHIAKFIYDKGAKIKNNCSNPIISASSNGHIDIVKYLVEKGADIHSDNDRALIFAAQQGHLEIVIYLLSIGANIHAEEPGKYGYNTCPETDYPLKCACFHGHLKVIIYLVDNGADVFVDKHKPLRWAVEYGHIEVVKYLLTKYENLDLNTLDLEESFSICCHREYLEMAKYLVANGLNVSKVVNNICIKSCYKGHLEVVKFLIKNGADLNDDCNEVLLDSCRGGNLEVFNFLWDTVKIDLFTIAKAQVSCCEGGNLQILKCLLDIRDICDFEKMLSNTIRYNHLEMFNFLLEKQDINSNKPLLIAVDYERYEMMEILIEKGCDIVTDIRPLAKAIDRHLLDIIEYLLEKGADVTLLNNETIENLQYIIKHNKDRPIIANCLNKK